LILLIFLFADIFAIISPLLLLIFHLLFSLQIATFFRFQRQLFHAIADAITPAFITPLFTPADIDTLSLLIFRQAIVDFADYYYFISHY